HGGWQRRSRRGSSQGARLRLAPTPALPRLRGREKGDASVLLPPPPAGAGRKATPLFCSLLRLRGGRKATHPFCPLPPLAGEGRGGGERSWRPSEPAALRRCRC